MSGCNALAPPAPLHRGKPSRRLPADGHRRPVQERCGHHAGCAPAAAHSPLPCPTKLPLPMPAPLWRTMMERWLEATT
ncbi:hypothetical protein ABMY26_26380 [Azospirillum sp. HJ39]|uniref:hypothetical protein n=1 Tax=Azospirillum sp. HJ39 TaxID=3159496 RepID=UPI0035575661